MRKCSKCLEVKDISCFYKKTETLYRSRCKPCYNEKKPNKQVRKMYYEKNKEHLAAYRKEYNSKNKIDLLQKKKEYYSNNRELLKKAVATHRNENKESINEKRRIRNIDKREKLTEASKKYYQENKQKRFDYAKNRKSRDPLFKMSHNLRSRIRTGIVRRGFSKNKKTIDILGVSYYEAKKHLENQFREGMSWDNYGLKGWHIDHIIPLCVAKTEQELLSLCHYTNLQPLWATDNLRKNKKLFKCQ
jgi:hypothetical protein